ncbi:hypothetical protein [Streptomyces sp. NBC_00470]|uniref:hypothetical protein n=1 Tax=Streptomyces sp. NBC_00470 TaxID=2975753 RepID=UPI0030DFA7D5
MHFYFAGAEDTYLRGILARTPGITHVTLSFTTLTKRRSDTDTLDLSTLFRDTTHLLIESGARSPSTRRLDPDGAQDLRERYRRFIENNIDRIDAFTEFDAPQLDRDTALITEHPDKGIAITHPDDNNLTHLGADIATSALIGLPREAVRTTTQREIVSRVRRDNPRIRLYGLGISREAVINAVPWHAATSASWIAPARMGELHLYAGNQLHWYGKHQRDDALARHQADVKRAGFNHAKLAEGDSTELLALSAWSWSMHMETRTPNRETPTPESHSDQNAAPPALQVDPTSKTVEKKGPTQNDPARQRATRYNDIQAEITESLYRDWKQTGEYSPLLAENLDRGMRLAKEQHSMDQETLSIQVRASGGAGNGGGMISRLFGAHDDGEPPPIEPTTPPTNPTPEADPIIDAEVVDDEEK